jgi:hypothetical protein
MTLDLKVLKCGNCEELKLGVHGLALGVAAVCGLYNAAAWLSRRERHLAVNAVLYSALIVFEHRHVAHHMEEIRRPPRTSGGVTNATTADEPAEPVAPPVAA